MRLAAATGFRVRVDDVDDAFAPAELAELQIAEHECPWGEMAQSYRAEYLGAVIQMAAAGACGDTKAAHRAQARAQRLARKLFG